MVRLLRVASFPTFSKVTLLLAALYGQSFAGGFQLSDLYSTTEIGLAGAGGAAYAQDATTNTSNPAGLVNLKNPEFVGGGTLVTGSAEFNGQACGGASSLGACNLAPTSDNGGTTAFIPEFHYAMPITDRIYAGISLTAPYGLSTDYGDDTALRYQATKSEIQTMNINPNIAFKFNDQFSLGGGIDIESMSLKSNHRFNLSPNPTDIFPGVPLQYSDSEIKNSADDWGVGWDVGALYQFSPGSRVGLAYRSAIQHDLSGSSKYSGGSGTVAGGAGGSGSYPTFKTDTDVDIKLPAMTTASFYQELNPKWAMMASVYYTQWSSIQNITLKDVALIDLGSTDLIQPSAAVAVNSPQNFDNTWRYSLGTEYKFTDALTFRMGGSYDQSPVNNTDRTIRLPDSNRWVGALGAGYRISPNVKLDASYMHVWFQDNAKINQPGTGVTPYLSSSIGTEDVSANLYSVQATIDFV
ncbi:MAG: ompP1 [Gammaproteobacteria bacterium]|jgi:long-chain fatty acid transport protein|nr:ompP1 [Gammaproteobacteria bacterium]